MGTGNTFGATAFSSFGAFWISFFALIQLKLFTPDTPVANAAIMLDAPESVTYGLAIGEGVNRSTRGACAPQIMRFSSRQLFAIKSQRL